MRARLGVLRRPMTAFDIVVFGALVAQPLPHVPKWDVTARRQVVIYLDGLSRRGLSQK